MITDYQMDDKKGNPSFVIAGVWQNQQMESDIVNQIKSAYPLDDFIDRINRAAESGKLVVIDKNKAKNMLATIGVQPSEVSNILNLAKDSLSQTNDTVKNQSRSSSDSDYLSAVERGDMETAQRMVDEAAKAAGYNTPMLYHGTQKFGFTAFDLNKMDDRISIFLTSTADTASTYSGVTGSRGINESTVKEWDELDELSTNELVDEYNQYRERFHSDKVDEEYRYYSYDDMLRMRDNTEKTLKRLRSTVQEVGYKYVQNAMNDFDDKYLEAHNRIREILAAIDKPVYSEEGYTNRDVADRYSDIGANLERLDAEGFPEFQTEEYRKLYDTLFVLDEVARNDHVQGKDAIIHVIEGIMYHRIDPVSLRTEMLREMKSGNYATYARLENPLVLDAKGAYWNRIPLPHEIWEKLPGLDRHWDRQDNEVSNTRAVSAYALDNGYDGVIFQHLEDNGGRNNAMNSAKSDVYVVFDSSQVKSADPVTYDDNGDVIPLSERFNPEKEDIRYQIRKDVNGNPFVDVDTSIYDETDGSSVASVIAQIISSRFNNLIEANGQIIRINATTNAEWRRSEDATKLMRKTPSIYDDKMKTIGNADEILTAANSWIGEKKIHKTNNKITEFARGNILYRVGKNGYIADVLVGTQKDGSAVLYDLVDIHKIKITEAPVSKADDIRLSSQRASIDPTLSQTADNVKQQSRPDADLFEESQWLDLDDDVSLLTHHFENNNRAIGEVLKKTSSIPVGVQDLRRRVKKVLLKYGLPESSVSGVYDALKNILDFFFGNAFPIRISV